MGNVGAGDSGRYGIRGGGVSVGIEEADKLLGGLSVEEQGLCGAVSFFHCSRQFPFVRAQGLVFGVSEIGGDFHRNDHSAPTLFGKRVSV